MRPDACQFIIEERKKIKRGLFFFFLSLSHHNLWLFILTTKQLHMNCCDFLNKIEQTGVLYCGVTIEKYPSVGFAFVQTKWNLLSTHFVIIIAHLLPFHALSLRSNNSFDYPSNSIFQMPSQFIFIFCNIQPLWVPVSNLAHDFTLNRRLDTSDVFIEMCVLV